MDSMELANQSPELKNFEDLTAEEHEGFKKSSIYRDVYFDYRYTSGQVKYYSSYYEKNDNLTFVVKCGSEFMLYAAIYPIHEDKLSYFKFPVKVFYK